MHAATVMGSQDAAAAPAAPARDVRQLRAQHEAGSAQASLRLCASILADRRGNWPEALEILRDLVDTHTSVQVVARAKKLLADAYVQGRGGIATAHQAREFYIDAADAGVASAYLWLGRWFDGSDARFASAVPDLNLAAHLYQEGVRAGSTGCAVALARLHLRGKLARSETTAAEDLLRRAARAGDPSARAELRRLDGDAPRRPIVAGMRRLLAA